MPTVLMLSANPKGTTPLRLGEELREVKEGLRRAILRDNFNLVSEHAVRTRDVRRAMLDHKPNILHFSGHGAGAKGLVLEDEVGEGKEVSGEAIAPLFALFKDSLQCVVLNACYSEVQAKAISEHIPFVVGMSDELDGKAAIEFAVAFYDAIGAGRDIRFAFELAKVAIKLAGIDQDHVPILLGKGAESKPLTSSAAIAFSTYNPDTFTGRDEETQIICEQFQRGCRIIAIVGMTGVGKTALAERAIATVAGDEALPYVRFSLDDRSIGTEFSSGGSALLRELGDEPTLEDQQAPNNLVRHILSRLQSHPCKLQIDSLERLLKGDEQDGWSEFCDPLWLSLFQRVLSVSQCGSQLILTTQDVPGELESVGNRFNQLWHYQALQGLSQQEQLELFRKLEVQDDQERLKHIGQFYDGHPLVLQVIADEIKQRPFNGSVTAYWERYGEEFEGAIPARLGDRSRIFRTRVRQRVEQTIDSLPESARQLLSVCSVFHRPVPETFWIEMGEGDDPYVTFDLLKGRNLVEYVDIPGQSSLVRLHNLIRSVAYGLLKGDLEVWGRAERKAANLWLTAYVVPLDAPKIETVRGYLEAFDHFHEIGDWEKVKEIAQTKLDTPTKEDLGSQLDTWGYIREQASLCEKYLEIAQENNDYQETGQALKYLRNAYLYLGQTEQSIDLNLQFLLSMRDVGNRQGESTALNNLGIIYSNLNQYQRAIDFFHELLSIAQEIGDRKKECSALSGLGDIYESLGQHQQAIAFFQQQLSIGKKMDDREEECSALVNLGGIYSKLNQYQQAIEFFQMLLSIAQQGGTRHGECNALKSLGDAYYFLGQYEQAIEFFQKLLSVALRDSDRWWEAIALGAHGNTYQELGQIEKSIDLFQKKLSIAQDMGNRSLEATTLKQLSNTQLALKKYPEALLNIQTALKIFHDIGDRYNTAETLLNLANLHYDLKESGKAIQFCNQALAIVEDIGDRQGKGMILSHMGNIQRKLRQYLESLVNNQTALKIFQDIDDRANQAEALLNLAKIHHDTNDTTQAFQFCQQALAIASEIGIPLKTECEELLRELSGEE